MLEKNIKAFYNSKAWKQARLSYLQSKFFICEKCSEPAETVHHITEITQKNINNPYITLNPKNFMALCKNCHNKVHNREKQKIQRRYAFDENGEIIYPPVEKKEA